jgi:molybdenum cofactor cytidylyltransferase
MTRIACLVPAAGIASRFGENKQLYPINDKPMVVGVLERLKPIFGDDLYTVLGAYRDEVRPVVENLSRVIEHSAWQSGLGSSIAAGVHGICSQTRYDGIMVALADQVAIGQSDYQKLVNRFDQQRIVASGYAGKTGVPALFPTRFFYRLQQLTGDRGARQLLRDNDAEVVRIPMPKAEIDIDTQSDLISFFA